MKPFNHLTILGIDTSCDDTSIAILKIKDSTPHQKLRFGTGRGFKILSNIISSQVKIHRKYGGVYPTLAKREHQRNLPIVLKRALKGAKLLLKKIDLIAITIGPGLEPCLWTGINFAKDLAKKLNPVRNRRFPNGVNLPIIPINHIEAHILANFLPKVSSNFQFTISNLQKIFPAICLVVSGGHTQLILMKDIGKYKILGETRDDAAGECFDKVARILGLGYPGGPAIEATATKLTKRDNIKIKLPRPMINQKNFDFSFSGLKTAVFYDFKNRSLEIRKSKKYIQAMAAEVQQAIIDVLIHKTIKAAKEYKAKAIILGGGVVANNELRKQFRKKIQKEIPNTKYLLPDTKFCTDNGAMIATTAFFRWLQGKKEKWQKIEAKANLRIS